MKRFVTAFIKELMKDTCIQSYYQLKGLLLLTLIVVSQGNTVPTSPAQTEPQGPCFMADHHPAIASQNLSETMHYLVLKVKSARLATTRLKEIMKAEYIQATAVSDHGDTVNIIPEADITATLERKLVAAANPADALKEHYALLTKLMAYVTYAKSNSQSTDCHGSCITDKLSRIETFFNQIMCDTRMALGHLNHDTSQLGRQTVPLLPAFINAGHTNDTHTLEIVRAYVVIKDSELVLKYLLQMFNAIKAAATVRTV